jgi:hypothetical protein
MLKVKQPHPSKQEESIRLTDRQRKIWQYLSDSSPEAAAAYGGAIRVLQDMVNPDKIAQSAHSLRELDNLLAPRIPNKRKDKDNSHVERIRKYMESQDLLGGLPEKLAQQIASHWVDVHGWFTVVSHHGKNPKEEDFNAKLQVLEVILLAQTGPFYASVRELDPLISTKKPSESDANRLKALIKKRAHYEYFFRTVSNPAWLPILVKEGYFKIPPTSIEVDGGVRFPFWTETQYLVKIANLSPKDVCEVIKNVPNTDNLWVHRDYLDAALSMPANVGKQLLKKAKKERWFSTDFFSRASEEGGNLMVKFAKEGEVDAAFELATLLLSLKKVELNDAVFRRTNGLKSHEAKSRIDEWEYGEILEKKVPALIEADPLRTIEVFANLLEGAIRIEREKKDYEDDNLLHVRRPAIEDSPLNYKHEDIKNLLITKIRAIVDNLAVQKSSKLKRAVESLAHAEGIYPIMLRLQLHAYRNTPEVFREEIKSVLSKKEYFDDTRLQHEYRLLIKSQFSNLPQKIKGKILDWIEKGPKRKDNDKNFLGYWQVQKLEPISDCLPRKWQVYYKGLIKKHKPDHQDSGSSHSSWVGPVSPLTEEEIKTKDPAKVIKYLSKWTPPKEHFGPSPEGLGRSLEAAIVLNAPSYSKLTKKAFDLKLRPVYLYHLVVGLTNSYKQGKLLEWGTVLDFCDSVMATEAPYKYPKDEGYFGETGWNGVRKAIADFFEEILKKGEVELPFKYRKKAWSILKRLVEDKDPDLEFEKQYGGDNMDPAMMSVNTVRGGAFHALLEYAMWVSRNLNKEDESKTVLVPEVKRVLEKHLNPKHDPTVTTRSVYGVNFPRLYYLDKNWASKNIQNIFPDPFEGDLAQSAWRAYLELAQFWVPSVKSLRSQYIQATKFLIERKSRDEADNRLAEHLMISYWRGDITLTDPLISNFYKYAPEDVRSHAVWYLWRSMEESKLKKTSKEWKRLKALWSLRVKENKSEKSKELSGFADWLSCAPEDVKNLSPLIVGVISHLTRGSDVGYLTAYLKENIKIDVELVSELLHQTVLQNPEDIKFRLHDEDIREISQSCFQSGSKKARDFSEKTINVFGERGNDSFRSILEEQQDKKPIQPSNKS